MAKKIVTRTPKQAVKHWIKALRSGKYTQGEGQLRKDPFYTIDAPVTFCCLGVLCDLAAKDGGPQWNGTEFLKHTTVLPAKVRHFVEMSKKMQYELVVMNDNDGKSFNQIANYLEKNLLPKVQ